jgi:glycine C-acetyltransferase
MKSKTRWLEREIAQLKAEGWFNDEHTLGSQQGAWLVVDGNRVLNFSSNNYLGLASDRRLVEAAKRAMDMYGIGPAAVRSIAGTMDLHVELERRLAEFKGVEAALTFQSGYNANLAVISTLVGEGDIIFSDVLNHASIIDGARLSGAQVIRYAHADPEDLLSKVLSAPYAGRRLIVTDGVFSMEGDIAPLIDIYEISRQHNILLMVDDAHGEGVLGHGGRGIVDHFELHGKVDIEVGTMSKAFGVVGGVVAGSQTLIDYLRQRARPYLYSSAMTVPDVAACLAALDILEYSTELVDRLWRNTESFRREMNLMGFDTGHTETPIVPVMLGHAQLAQKFSRRLFDEGVFAMPISYPVVPKGKARIRVMNTAMHSLSDIEQALAAFETVGREFGVIS